MAPIADQDVTPPAIYSVKSYPPPTHPGLLQVVRSDKPFGSGAVSLVSLPAGAIFARIEPDVISVVPEQRYTTVQIDRNTHIELNSDLVYCNHSCDPSVVFDMHKNEVRVVDGRPLKSGDALTFFYPSTEWYMDQPFDCTCGSSKCKGRIDGAGNMQRSQLEGYWLNDHVVQLLKERDNVK